VRPHPTLGHLEEALALLETGMSDLEMARKRQLSARTIEDHKRKILEVFGTTMEARHQGSQGSPATWASGAVTSSMIRPGTDQRGAHRTRDTLGKGSRQETLTGTLCARRTERRAICFATFCHSTALAARRLARH
jgi:hypothetical protein